MTKDIVLIPQLERGLKFTKAPILFINIYSELYLAIKPLYK